MKRWYGATPAMYFSYLAACKEAGIDPPPAVSQGIGGAKASAGTHAIDGYLYVKGKREPYCAAFDLSVRNRADGTYRPLTTVQKRALVIALVNHGFVAYYRNPGHDHWPEGEAEHFHCVWVNVKMKEALRSQVHDFLADRNGLRSHAHYNYFNATPAQKNLLRAAFLEAN